VFIFARPAPAMMLIILSVIILAEPWPRSSRGIRSLSPLALPPVCPRFFSKVDVGRIMNVEFGPETSSV
jgi:hypothetical protein